MKTYKLTVLLFAFQFIVTNARAQSTFKNSVKLNVGGLYMADRHTAFKLDRFFGVYYERSVYKDIGVGIGYSQWALLGLRKPSSYFINEPLGIYDTAYGTLEHREGYKMIDLYGFYRLNVYKKHSIKGGLGLSCSWGKNIRIEQKKYSLGWYYDTYRVYTEKASYWGVVPQISYDYAILKNRFNVGVDLRGRFYSGISPAQYDYGIHAGVNF